MQNTLYLECFSGISGDMFVASLIDLGADTQVLNKALATIPVCGFQISVKRVKKSGLDACDFLVMLDKIHENHDHDMEYLHGPLNHHCHTLHHEQRKLYNIFQIIEQTSITDNAKRIAKKIFQILAEAEAEAHGTTIEEVHFHEVGAVDSIVDIISSAVCIDNLNIEEVIITELYEGRGTVRCQHGVLPVPVPAVTNIVNRYHLKLHITDIQGELITPTGAAIAAAIQTSDQLPNHFYIERIGIGAGKRKYRSSGILRAMLIRKD